jgi:hypothetical protein
MLPSAMPPISTEVLREAKGQIYVPEELTGRFSMADVHEGISCRAGKQLRPNHARNGQK